MSNDIVLRPYQQECVDIINNLEPGSYLVALYTGAGKTVIFSQIERRGRMLILSHREELVHQPQKYFDCSFGVERAEETSNGEDVISASVQTLIHRLEKFDPKEFDILITDECHHAIAPSYRKIYDYFKPRLHLGFTATPNRADKSYLGDIYSKIIFEKNIKWGIDNNYLSDIECFKINIGYDLSKVKIRMGDFANNELADAVDLVSCNKAVADIYNEYAVGKTVIFAASVAHAENIAAQIPGAEVIKASTENRAEILDRFQNGNLDCIVNCMILTEGTDLPCIETIMIVRPTKNVSLYTQMVGRGTRIYQGKNKLRLIDCVGASSMDICTAPVLFGIDPEIAEKTKQDSGLLSDMEQRIEDIQNDWLFNRDFWKYNTELIDLFRKKGDYDLHGINFTVLGNKDMICSLGDCKTLRITAEDMIGNSSIYITDRNKPILTKEGLKMQDALDQAHMILVNDYSKNKSLWDKESVEKWGSAPVSAKQIKLINDLYDYFEIKKLNIDVRNLDKYQASILISRKFAEKPEKPFVSKKPYPKSKPYYSTRSEYSQGAKKYYNNYNNNYKNPYDGLNDGLDDIDKIFEDIDDD